MKLPFLTEAATASGYRPCAKVSPAATSGAPVGGLMAMVASLLGAPQADPWADHLREIEITLAVAPALSSARLLLASTEQTPNVALDDLLKIELGYDDSFTPLFTGPVIARQQDGVSLSLKLASQAHAFTRLRQNSAHENRTLADLLRLWAGEAEVETGQLATGPTYPYLAIDDRRSLWSWMAELAADAGAWLWLDGDGKVNCQPAGGPVVRSYGYGTDLLDLRFVERNTLPGTVTVVGEGAAGSQGSQAWSRLVKDSQAVRAQAGQGDPRFMWQRGALRSLAAAQTAAGGWSDAARQQQITVEVRVPGSPELLPGQLFNLKACPRGEGDGDYLLHRVRHRYDRHGFLTELTGSAP